MPLSQMQKRVRAGEIDSIYVLVGDDAFLRGRAVQTLVEAIAAEEADDPGMAYERFDASETSITEILDVARSLPLFLPVTDRPVRVIRVTDFDPTGLEDDELEILREYVLKPVPETCLAFEAVKIDRRPRASKLLLENGLEVDCSAPKEARDIARWIEGKAESMGIAIDREGVSYMMEMVGNNLQQLDQELQKLDLYVGDQKRVGAADLEALLERSREHSVFELTEALVAGDEQRSVETLNFLYDDGASAYEILPMIAWIVRQMVIASDLMSQGLPEKEISRHLRGRWDTKKAVLARARRSRLADLQRLLVACAETDIPAKVRRGNAERGTLEALCRRVCAA
jgi:DNA polymerase-3 subunit delta